MPFQPTLPTWLALNAANFTSPSSFTDLRTQQPIYAGGLNLGDYFDLTESEANGLSNTATGLLHAGRYRLVQVAAGATAANVKTGTVAGLAFGPSVQQVAILTAGSGQTPGSYQASASGGGGTGAVIQYTIGAGGTLTAASVLTGGINYTSLPTFTIAAGGTPGTVAAQMSITANAVTSYDLSVATTLIRGVFLNSITPGNYGFIQELGEATVLAGAAVGTTAVGALVNASTAGVVVTVAGSGSPTGVTVGTAIDVPANSILFRCVIDSLPILQG